MPGRKKKRLNANRQKYKLPAPVKAFLSSHPYQVYTDWVMPEDLPEEPPPPKGVSALEWSKQNDFVFQRLEYMRGLMSRLIYNADKHNPILAEKWHMAPRGVANVAQEASRALRMLNGNDDPRARETFTTILLGLAERAEAAGEFVAAVSATNKAADLCVEPRTQKIDISHEARSLTDAELNQRVKKLMLSKVALLEGPDGEKISKALVVAEAEYEDVVTEKSTEDDDENK